MKKKEIITIIFALLIVAAGCKKETAQPDPVRLFRPVSGGSLVADSNAILVSGSFGRSMFSEMFRKSFVSDVIAEHKLPVFIAHK